MASLTFSSSCLTSLPCLIPAKYEPLHARSLSYDSSLPSSSSRRRLMICNNLKNSVVFVVKCSSTPSSGRRNIPQDFHPSIWNGHDFLSSSPTDLKPDELRLQELKKEVKNMFSLAAKDPFQELDLVDKIQRIGVAYHFETEIKDILERAYNQQEYDHFFFGQNIQHSPTDLHQVALRFRLLRQAGYYVSPAIFDMFKDENGDFHENVASDIRGILCLYEASHLSFNGEDTMDEAMDFTTKVLKSMVAPTSSMIASQVHRALEKPLHKSTKREQSRHYISIYHHHKVINQTLVEFAKLDYNSVQLLYQKELAELLRWWDHLNFKEKMPFKFRERVVEAYAMSISWSFEPQFSLVRINLAKMWCIFTVLDDAYDGCDNLDDLRRLSDAFQRWDIRDAHEMPNNMKVLFLEVLKFFNEIKACGTRKGNFICIEYLRKEIQSHTRGLYDEAKMLFLEELPTFKKCLSVSVGTLALNAFLINALMSMDELVTNEVLDWLVSMPKIIRCSSLFQRLFDDIADYEVEKDSGFLISSVTCYMNDHKVSELEAIESLQKMTTRLWKDHNQEILRVNNPLPMPVITILLNIARNMILYYSDGDGHTNSDGLTREIITSLLIDPILL